MNMELFPSWYRWCMRVMLAGFALGAISIAAVAWFNDPPFATTIFYAGLVFVGGAVVAGMIGIIVTGRWRGH